ncbi:MAG: MSMEG_0565 family glycosyltransferase [Candidatus Dadabacteria bacterium]|nr:MSMEG_0565 family glycosyltransferase [Candidatus Dadabacteria bacterium]
MNSNRIALLTYSTKPRGGVAHTLSLAESLVELNQDVHVYALATGREFFRQVDVPYTLIECPEIEYSSMDEKIKGYIGIYTDYLQSVTGEYEIFHAEDCISANALLNLRDMGLINYYVRTIHHIDDFTSKSLIECQLKSIVEPDYMITVSKFWRRELSEKYSLSPIVINNGVSIKNLVNSDDTHTKENAKKSFNVNGAKVILSIGGIEPRKNTITTLRAFNIVRLALKTKGEKLVWLIGGGETLFDYMEYRDEFFSEVENLGLELDKDVFVLGNVPESKMQSLYNSADVFVFPSIKEGWGLVVQEAMAAGVPVIASGIEPMTEYLVDEENSLLISPMDYDEMAQKIIMVFDNLGLRSKLIENGRSTANIYSWENAARKHIDFYNEILKEKGVSIEDKRAVGDD